MWPGPYTTTKLLLKVLQLFSGSLKVAAAVFWVTVSALAPRAYDKWRKSSLYDLVDTNAVMAGG